MAIYQQKAQWVLWFTEFKSIVSVQQHFKFDYGVYYSPLHIPIKQWVKKFKEMGSILKSKSSGRSQT